MHLFIIYLYREGSRVVIIPFPRIEEANPLSEQLQHEDRLKRKCKRASKAIGCILGIPQEIDAELQRSTIESIESKLGPGNHYRVIRNYVMLMMFASKVCN
jgi:hypothetical protein